MVGDILLHTPVAKSAQKDDGGYDFTAIFANLKEEISKADLALVNQEVIIGGSELKVTGYPAFNAPYELGHALMDAGFDIVCHATNHALDKGKQGLVNCLNFWETNYPKTAILGIHGTREESEEITVYEMEGIRIAFLNYTYSTNGKPFPEDMPYAVDMLKKDEMKADLQKASEMADFVVVAPHWGTEYVLEETNTQKNWAKFFADNGADLVLGTHPHVIEPIDWVDETLVYYSLGNFVNWTSSKGDGIANRMVGGMAMVTLSRGEDGEVFIKEAGVEPIVAHLEQGFAGVTVYALDEYTEELAQKNEIIKQDPAFTYAYCMSLADRVFGDWILEDEK
jgi:poly-gamma-glutamate synthesis protein (capsule biosynthesis protein)